MGRLIPSWRVTIVEILIICYLTQLCMSEPGELNHSFVTSKPMAESIHPLASTPSAQTLEVPTVGHLVRSGYDTLFPNCKPPCLNGGVCRTGADHEGKCICPVDYKGDHCQNASQPPLKFCDETTCHNGGTCTGTATQPACSCPPDILGRTCERRIRTYEIDLLVMTKNKPMNWSISLTNPLSSIYKNISNDITEMLDAACKLGNDLRLVKGYYGNTFLGFGNGSLNAKIMTKFDLEDSVAKNYSESIIRQHILTGGRIVSNYTQSRLLQVPTNFNVLNTSTFTVKAINPCLSGNNDCSVNAVCTMIGPGVYTCTCKAFTIDSSLNRAYPGRRCVYDGLIILSFILVGSLISMLIFLLCGCRRTIWYRYKNRGYPEHFTLVNMPSNYDI